MTTKSDKEMPGGLGEDSLIIGSTTKVDDIVSALARRGCPDLTSSLDLDACSARPRTGGGFCDVYQGTISHGTKVAIKSLRLYDTPGADNEQQKVMKRAARELYHWSKLKHPNILPLLGLAMFREHMSMISEWMDNGNLISYVRTNPGANRTGLCMDVCAGLVHIHANEMVHGDLKAANVMVSPNGVAMIADFGNTQLKDLTLRFSNTRPSGFSAPEILLAETIPPLTKEADVYAYAMTALETLTGQVPYEGLSEQQVMIRLLHQRKAPARPPASIGISDGLWKILQSCWARKQSKRPDISKVRQRLGALFPHQPREATTQESKVGSPVYHDASSRGQRTTSELNLDQTPKLRQLRSRPSQLGRSAKPPSNASVDSFYTGGPGSDVSEPAQMEDVAQSVPSLEPGDPAKAFAKQAWQEDPNFVEREKLVEWLGSPRKIRQQTLVHYMAHFDFSSSDIDESIRSLCNKLYIKGKPQQIDRILEAFSEHYMSQNQGSLWRLADIVHVVSFAIILLNTDLQAAKLSSHITSPRFVENTMEVIRIQMNQERAVLVYPISPEGPTAFEPLSDIDELPQASQSPSRTPSGRASSPPATRPPNTRDRLTSVASGHMPLGRDSWVVASAPSDGGDRSSEVFVLDERWISEMSRELTSIFTRVRARPILQRGGAEPYRSLRGESPHGQLSPSASGTSFVSALGHRVSSSMSSLPHFLGITSNPSLHSSTNADPSRADSPWAKTGPLLWKAMKPTPGRIAKPKRWSSVVATVQTSIFDMAAPVLAGSTAGAGRRLGALSLLHTLALEVPAPKGAKVRSFGLTLASGETHMFEIQGVSNSMLSKSKSKSKSGPDPDAEVLAWVRACNYHAARYSRVPLPDAVTNVEYGWNGAGVIEDDQSTTSDRPRNVLINEWVAPTLPYVEAQTDLETQLDVWNRQVETVNTEFAEHGELRGRIMNLYRPGSAQAQKALSNWEKKAQYLLTEIVKYETYAEILKNAEQALRSSP